jgi:hypothetical protein
MDRASHLISRLFILALRHSVRCVLPIPFCATATEELLWLTCFKGLIAANTHPRDQMLNAIDAIRRRRSYPIAEISANSAAKLKDVAASEIDRTPLADALAAIDRALSNASYGEATPLT